MLLHCRPSIRHTINIRSLHITPRRLQRELFDPRKVERVSDDVDVCIVGGGPAGLSAAIRLKQLEKEKGKEIRVVVLEKGAEVGESRCIISLWSWTGGKLFRCFVWDSIVVDHIFGFDPSLQLRWGISAAQLLDFFLAGWLAMAAHGELVDGLSITSVQI
jgi:hypothetical protein